MISKYTTENTVNMLKHIRQIYTAVVTHIKQMLCCVILPTHNYLTLLLSLAILAACSRGLFNEFWSLGEQHSLQAIKKMLHKAYLCQPIMHCNMSIQLISN